MLSSRLLRKATATTRWDVWGAAEADEQGRKQLRNSGTQVWSDIKLT